MATNAPLKKTVRRFRNGKEGRISHSWGGGERFFQPPLISWGGRELERRARLVLGKKRGAQRFFSAKKEGHVLRQEERCPEPAKPKRYRGEGKAGPRSVAFNRTSPLPAGGRRGMEMRGRGGLGTGGSPTLKKKCTMSPGGGGENRREEKTKEGGVITIYHHGWREGLYNEGGRVRLDRASPRKKKRGNAEVGEKRAVRESSQVGRYPAFNSHQKRTRNHRGKKKDSAP